MSNSASVVDPTINFNQGMHRNVRTHEAAKYLNLSESTLEKMRLSGEGPPFMKSGKRVVVYKVEDLETWLEKRKYQSTSQ